MCFGVGANPSGGRRGPLRAPHRRQIGSAARSVPQMYTPGGQGMERISGICLSATLQLNCVSSLTWFTDAWLNVRCSMQIRKGVSSAQTCSKFFPIPNVLLPYWVSRPHSLKQTRPHLLWKFQEWKTLCVDANFWCDFSRVDKPRSWVFFIFDTICTLMKIVLFKKLMKWLTDQKVQKCY